MLLNRHLRFPVMPKDLAMLSKHVCEKSMPTSKRIVCFGTTRLQKDDCFMYWREGGGGSESSLLPKQSVSSLVLEKTSFRMDLRFYMLRIASLLMYVLGRETITQKRSVFNKTHPPQRE